MKIPTLIGLALIIALIASAVFLFLNKGKAENQPYIEVINPEPVNITHNTATIIWQTSSPTIGQVIYGETEVLKSKAYDNRDLTQLTPRLTHFITIKNLKPGSRYFYQVINNSAGSNPQTPLEFKTSSLEEIDDLEFSFIKPLKGTILNTNLNPIDESLIFLEIEGAQKIATVSSTAGNFILPLKIVLDDSLSKMFKVAQGSKATLIVKRGNLESKINLVISDTTIDLPPITIGTNLDLSSYKKQPYSIIQITEKSLLNFDFNSDNKINSLDLAILREKTTSREKLQQDEIKKFDINTDGIVDSKDIEFFTKNRS